MPSAVLLSIVIHVALFLLAGMLVVFTVVKKEEQKFEPPKAVERPKMKLKKPKVKVRKSSKPKPTTRIVTKINRASMPDIQLPEMSGMGDGLAGGIAGGFDLMPDFSETTVFGEGQSIGNDFVGTFYDMKRDRSGRNIPHDRDNFRNVIFKFLRSGWSSSKLGRYYQSPKKLYAITFAFPRDLSTLAPSAFGEENCIGWLWAAHYKGQLVYPEDITFRFWGTGDDFLAVRVGGELVLLTVADGRYQGPFTMLWNSSSADSGKYPIGNQRAVVGDWITLKAGVSLDMEVLVGEIPGGNFGAMLCVEVEGVEYPRNPYLNGPTLPIFKTEEPSIDLVEAIHNMLYEDDASVTNGPVFRDYKRINSESRSNKVAHVEPVETTGPEAVADDGVRMWNTTGGKTFEAEYVLTVSDKVVFKNGKGRQIKIPLEQLSAADLDYISLRKSPKFSIDFSKKSRQIQPPKQPPETWDRPVRRFGYEFGVKLKQESTGTYNHDLQIEYFAVGEEVDGDNYILLERRKRTFNPAEARDYEFYGEEVRIQSQSVLPFGWTPMRGSKYGGFLITITDERGKIIQYKASHKFLFENIETLKKLSVGRHFNRECEHVGPPRPERR